MTHQSWFSSVRQKVKVKKIFLGGNQAFYQLQNTIKPSIFIHFFQLKFKKTYLELPKLFYMKLKVKVRPTEKLHFKTSLQTWYESRARFALVCLSVLFLWNSKEPCCTQKYAAKKDAFRPWFPFSHATLKRMRLLYGKTHRCWWNPRLVGVPHVHSLAS